jgi:hypothetical protein
VAEALGLLRAGEYAQAARTYREMAGRYRDIGEHIS